MKKILKIIGISLGGLLLVGFILIGALAFNPLPTYETVPIPNYVVSATPEMLAFGQKLVMMNCASCHYDEAETRLSGRLFPDAESRVLGTIYTANITQHPEHGIGPYTDAELYRLLRTGIKRDHQLALPMMSGTSTLSDEDLAAIIAFLKSDHPLVQADPTEHPDFEPSLLTRVLYQVAFKPKPMPAQVVVAPAPSDQIAYGKYLLEARYGCYHCHSTKPEDLDPQAPHLGPGYLQGGMVFDVDDWHGESYQIETPSLLDRQRVLAWSEDQFVGAVIWGQRPDRRPYKLPMHPYTMMDSTEAQAIYRYLQQHDTQL
jgi:mono/diheme cytochrome c family protein